MVELKTKQQKRLHERLDEIQPKIESEDFLKNQGLGNEIGFYVFDYPPEAELTVREHLEYMTERLDKRGRNFKSINLFEAAAACYIIKFRRMPVIKISDVNSIAGDLVAAASTGEIEELRETLEHRLSTYNQKRRRTNPDSETAGGE